MAVKQYIKKIITKVIKNKQTPSFTGRVRSAHRIGDNGKQITPLTGRVARIILKSKQQIPFGTRVGSAHRHGRAALILARKLRNVPNSILLFAFAVFAVSSGILSNNSFALTYQDTLDTSFTFNSSVSLALSSSDLVINDLLPNTYADSNIITITAMSNNPYGYQVTASSGDGSTYTDNSLIHNGDGISGSISNNSPNNNSNNGSTPTFTSLPTNASYDIASSDFSSGAWGYTYCATSTGCSSSNYWINATGGNGYSGLPYYNTSTASLISSSTNGSTSIDFKIGAKANNNQAAGTYNNVVNFTITATPEPIYTMQEFALGTASTTCSNMSIGDTLILLDSRDSTPYTIGKLADNRCWMLDNLAIDLTKALPSYQGTDKINLTTANTNASEQAISCLLTGSYQGSTCESPYTGTAVSSVWANSYTDPKINMDSKNVIPQGNDPMASQVRSGNWKVGGYYNYCAASAGSYCYDPSFSEYRSRYDICPANWRLPSGNANGEFAILYKQYNDLNVFRDKLHLSLSTASNLGIRGTWWTRDRYDNSHMYYLNIINNNISTVNAHFRFNIFNIRCILN